MKKCEICGTAMNDDVDLCPECGASVKAKEAAAENKTCPSCGASVAANKKFCPKCGAKMSEEQKTAEEPAAVSAFEETAPIAEKAAFGGKTCSVCGARVAANKKFCPECGAKMAEEQKTAEEPTAETHSEEAAPIAEKAAFGGKTCSVCGASVAVNKKFCPECGAKMAEEQKTAAEPTASPFEETAPIAEKAVSGGKICSTCGASVASNKKFCPQCGAKMAEEQKFSYCRECGAKIADGKKFCPECGTEVLPDTPRQESSKPVSKTDYKPTGEAATAAGKVMQLLPTIGIALTLILTIVFMFVPFLSAKVSMMGVEVAKFSHGGVTGLAVLFTGKSSLITLSFAGLPMGGASEIVMRLVGAGYILLILALIWYILFAISSVFRYSANSLKHQIIMSAILTAISLFLMVLMCIAKSDIKSSLDSWFDNLSKTGTQVSVKTSWFMGAVGLFIVNALMLAYAIFMRVIYKPALDRPALTPELLGKKTRSALIVADVLILIACIVIPIVTGCSGSKGKSPDKAETISSSGTFSVKCDGSQTETDGSSGMTVTMYYGVRYFVYTPKSDGTVTVTIDNAEPDDEDIASATTLRAVEIAEYDVIYKIYGKGGNYAVVDWMSGDTTSSCNVKADTKYCIAFAAITLSKNSEVSVSYTFDNGGTDVSDADRDNELRGNATTVFLGSNSTGSIPNGNTKYYKFTPSSSGTYKIYTSTYDGDPDISVYDSVSSSFPKVNDRTSGGFDVDVSMTSGKTYYIAIYASGSSSCTFVITKNGGDSSSPDGSSRTSAITLTLDSEVSADEISSSGKWYRFVPSTNGTYKIAGLRSDGDPDIRVYRGSSSDYITTNTESGWEDVTVEMTSGATYYIEIYRSGSLTFRIELVSEVVDGSTRDKAIAINQGQEMPTGMISSSSSKWYKFTPSESGQYALVGKNCSGDPDVRIYRGTNLDYFVNNTNGGWTDVAFAANYGTTYYFEIYRGGSVTLTVDYAAGINREYAIEISLGSRVETGALTSGGKWYMFTPSESGNYIIKSSDYSGNPDIKIFRGSGSTSPIASSNAVGWSDAEVTMTNGSTYYVQIYSNSGYSRCEFYIESGVGLSRNYAINISLGSPVETGALTSSGKWYKYTASANGRFAVSSNDYSGDPDVNVYSGASSYTIASNSDIGWVNVEADMTAGTTYYIHIFGNGNCTFEVSRVPGAGRADAIELEAFVDVNTGMFESNSRWYKYTPTVNATHIIKGASVGGGNPDVKVYVGNSTNATVSDTNDRWNDVTLTDMAVGTVYYIEIKMNISSGSVEFSIDPVISTETGNENSLDATVITLGQFYKTNLSTSSGKYYKFAPTTSGIYVIKCYEPSSSRSHMRIYESTTSSTPVIDLNDDNWNECTVYFSSSNNYYIYFYTSGTSATFSVKNGPDGSSREQAIGLMLNYALSTGSMSSNQYKYYKFTPKVTANYRITSSSNTGDPDLYIYNSLEDEYPIYENDNSGGFGVTVQLNANTTYYIAIKAFSAGSTRFDIIRYWS